MSGPAGDVGRLSLFELARVRGEHLAAWQLPHHGLRRRRILPVGRQCWPSRLPSFAVDVAPGPVNGPPQRGRGGAASATAHHARIMAELAVADGILLRRILSMEQRQPSACPWCRGLWTAFCHDSTPSFFRMPPSSPPCPEANRSGRCHPCSLAPSVATPRPPFANLCLTGLSGAAR